MLEKYYKYKSIYPKHVIFIKVGNFYECLGNDALILNKLFGYKIKRIGNTIKSGFPISGINLNLDELKDKEIYHVVIDGDNVSSSFDSGKNTYDKYVFDIDTITYNMIRIDKIVKYLEENIINDNIN